MHLNILENSLRVVTPGLTLPSWMWETSRAIAKLQLSFVRGLEANGWFATNCWWAVQEERADISRVLAIGVIGVLNMKFIGFIGFRNKSRRERWPHKKSAKHILITMIQQPFARIPWIVTADARENASKTWKEYAPKCDFLNRRHKCFDNYFFIYDLPYIHNSSNNSYMRFRKIRLILWGFE